MFVVDVRNVNHALRAGLKTLREHGVARESRNGQVLMAEWPVTTVYRKPMERVLFDPVRDANPFFHLVESMWMLAGRDDLATLTPYVANMSKFSDDGGRTQPGAYGMRWRRWFTHGSGEFRDQLLWAIRRLQADGNDRRVIIQMYDADYDQDAADQGGKDVPCNIVAAPWIDCAGRLSLTVFCRSNDMIWGAYGANAVHFAFLMEYLAAGIGCPVGAYYQVSNNFHAYFATMDKASDKTLDLYSVNENYKPFPLFGKDDDATLKQFDEDLTIFFDEPTAPGLRSRFLRQVACPMVMAHKAYRNKSDPNRFKTALEIIDQCKANDWRTAGADWLLRRKRATEIAKDDGVSHA